LGFAIVMYRGYIIAQYKNMFDIADIDADRRERPGDRTFWTSYTWESHVIAEK
jgi:hypothetical protein